MSRRNWLIGLGAVVVIVAVVVAIVALNRDGGGSVATSSSSSALSSASSSAPSSTSAPVSIPAHVWPFGTSSSFTSPADAARSFAIDYLGMTNAQLGMTSASGATTTVEVFPNERGMARTVVNVADAGGVWYVTGANADSIVVDQPHAHAAVTSPLAVSGKSTAFEAQIGLELRPIGSKRAVATATAMGGANGEMGPFSTTITPPSTEEPLVLVVFAQDESGEQTYSYATVVLLGV